MTASALYFTRWTAEAGGPYPVRIEESESGARKIELTRSSEPELFSSTKEFLATVHGDAYVSRHWTLDRYLARGRYAPSTGTEAGITVVGPLQPVQYAPAEIVVAPMPASSTSRSTRSPVRPKSSSRQGGISVVTRCSSSSRAGLEQPRGIDLKARGHEVAKLLYAGFSAWIHKESYEFEDVLQEVYRKILVANAGTRPWDPSKSSFGHYVHLVCRSALSNYHRKVARVRTWERPGLAGYGPDGTWSLQDVRVSQSSLVSCPARTIPDPVGDLQQHVRRGLYADHPDNELAAQLVPYIQAGYTLKDTAGALGVDRALVSKAMKLLRLCTVGWGH